VGNAPYRILCAAIAGVAALAAAGCSNDHPGAKSAQTVSVTERDFRISAPKRIPTGDVTLAVRNKGPDHHELLLVREHGDELPLRNDGLTVDEDAIEPEIVGVLEAEEPGVHKLKVHLEPGHYEFLCNMSGHYMGGMEANVVAQ
jgi:uncharacterized cupredoxin-like copper-binding protein